MNTHILNRVGALPADGWYEIETPGEHFNPAAGIVQLLDAQAFDSIVNRFKAEAAKPNFAGLLIDQDHFSLDPAKSSESFGWLMEVRNRDGHLEGKIDWTDIGEPAVTKKRFKFFSTVYDPADVAKVGSRLVNNRAYPLVRPLALDRLALTNDPNNKGGKPISNRDGKSAGAAENQNHMKALLKKLGLAEDASEDSAVTAVLAITNRATSAETERDALKKERDTLLTAQVDADLEKYKNRYKPENRETLKKQLIANRALTIELLDATAPAETKPDPVKITNRTTATTPAGTPAKDEVETAKEKARGAKISNRAAELRKLTPSLSRSAAFAKAERELTE
jgi:phage I-like protein